MRLKNLVLLLLGLGVFNQLLISQERYFPVINYKTKDYGRDFHPENWAIAQDKRGIIYAANAFKLLEFDGRTWNSYPINKEVQILSLAIDESGFVYAGAQNEFGYFSPDKLGKLKYISLSDSLDLKDTEFTNIWKVHSFSGGVAFQSEEKIFIRKKGKTKVINPQNTFHTSFIVNDKLYVRERGRGLLEWNGKELERVKGGEIFDTTGIFTMLPFENESRKILIGTREKGFWIYDPASDSNRFSKFNIENQKTIDAALVNGGTVTGDGMFVIGTLLNGIFILDKTGKITATVNRNSGLTDNDVKHLILDESKNLWLALNNGISRVEISSPLTFLSEKTGLTGSINALQRYNGVLYAGTTSGLFAEKTDLTSSSVFEPITGIRFPVRCLTLAEGKLIVGTDAGLFEYNGRESDLIGENESFALFYSPEMKLLFSGGSRGLSVFRYNKDFEETNLFSDIQNDIIGIASGNTYKNDSAEIWIGTRYNGVLRIKAGKSKPGSFVAFGRNDGLPEGPVSPAIMNSEIVFATGSGFYRFIDEATVKKSLPDSLKNNKDFLKGYFSSVKPDGAKIGTAVSFITETDSKVWICSDNNTGFFDKLNKMQYIEKPFRGIDVGKINFVYPDEAGIAWIGTTDGLIRYDENKKKDYENVFHGLIRKITSLKDDSVVFMGTNIDTFNGSGTIVLNRIDGKNQVFAYRNNSIRFDFSATFYEFSEKTTFSYFLEGEEETWSHWINTSYKEYSNLREGKYTFRVKAKNVYGKESDHSFYTFTILPPWYRSVTAYIIYTIAGLLLIWLFAQIYSYRLKRENFRLEGIVTERTAEVVRQKDIIENKNIVLEVQKKEIEDSIRYASRIQSAVIPSEKDCFELIPECFVFFRPLNIVSGDFYWISKTDEKVIFTAADCTGHGVPGAIMSMLGVAFLNEIVNKDHVTAPALILNQLRDKVIGALQQQGISGEARDGMDIALVTIDYKMGKIYFAGAYNPLVMIRNGEIIDTPGDKMPIGFYDQMNSFTQHEMKLLKGDRFYMSSDGYEDQFGGPEGKKFKSRKFKQMLLEIHHLPMQKQKEIIEKQFEEWKGELPQIDDIVVTGFEIT
jgi:serine phosphatase RsbU (regulator of sigma subunit)/ligand-binding sensor domain-containing protein